VEFTSTDGDIAAEKMLGQNACFSLYGAPQPPPFRGLSVPSSEPLRVLHGVVTGFKRLSGSVDEARYEITLQPRLALLGRGRQFRIYQHQSVPQIVESILRSRHDFEGQDFLFKLVREYPRREQVMQYGESDLAFISRLLADVGIWYRFTHDERLNIDVVEFHDDQRHYTFDVELAYRPQSGLSSSGKDSTWGLQSSHHVVEKRVNIRTYHHHVANAHLNGEIDKRVAPAVPTARLITTPKRTRGWATDTPMTKTCKAKVATSMLACVTSITSTARPDSAASAVAPPWRPARS